MQSHHHRHPLREGEAILPKGQAVRYDSASTALPHRIQVGETTVDIRYRVGGPSLQQKMAQLCQEMY